MFPQDSTRKLAIVPRIKRSLFVLFVFVFTVFLAGHFSESLQGADFPDFYCAARMLADGHGHQLYDAEVQRQYQARYSGRVGTLYIHPPFEAVLYLAVAWLPLQRAYLLWSLLSMVFLAIGTRRLAKEIPPPWGWEVLFAASLIFVPLLLCLQQGQDSLFFLLLVICAFVALRREQPFAAGCWLGLGLFKFQIVVPIVLVLILSQSRSARRGLAKGFGVVALTLAGMSAAISGWSVFTDYPKFLLHLQTEPFAGITAQAMANLRGLTYFFFRSDHSSWAIAALTVLCAAALIMTPNIWKHARLASAQDPSNSRHEFDLAFVNTVLFALLVSYHLNPHDLSLLLLPISLLLYHGFTRPPRLPRLANWINAALIGIMFLPPLHLSMLREGVYALVGLPLLALFLRGAFLARRNRAV